MILNGWIKFSLNFLFQFPVESVVSVLFHIMAWQAMGLLPDTQICGLPMRREGRERFPRYQLQRKPQVSDPVMHHGTCVTHVPRCMVRFLTRGGGKRFPAFPTHAQPAILRIWWEAHSNKYPDCKVHKANMGPTWVLSAPYWPYELWYLGNSLFFLIYASIGHSELAYYSLVIWTMLEVILKMINRRWFPWITRSKCWHDI